MSDADDYAEMVANAVHRLDGGDTAGASRWLEQAARTSDPVLLTDVGYLFHQRLGDLERAESCYRRAAGSGSVVAMSNLGALLRSRDDLGEAEQWLSRAAAEGYPDALNNLGNVLERRGRLDRAMDCWRAAAEGGSSTAMVTLSMRLAISGHHDEARLWQSRAAESADPAVAVGLAAVSAILDAAPDTPLPTPGGPSDDRDPLTIDIDDIPGTVERARAAYLRGGDPHVLDLGIGLCEEFLRTMDRHDGDHVAVRACLGALHHLRYAFEGIADSLEQALQAGHAAIGEALPSDDCYPLVLSRQGAALVDLFRRTGTPGHLDEALQLHEEAVDALAPDDPLTAELLSAHGDALLAQAVARDDDRAVDRAIVAQRGALRVTTEDAPERAVRCFQLAMALLHRSGPVERDEARGLLEHAHRLLPAAHRLRSSVESALEQAASVADRFPATGSDQEARLARGATLVTRHEHGAAPAGLDEAAAIAREAMASTPHRTAASILLAAALRLRAHHTGEGDLLEALALMRRVVRETPNGDGGRAEATRLLAAIVLDLGVLGQDTGVLREAVGRYRDALEAALDRPTAAADLANALLVLRRHNGELDGVDEAVTLTDEALQAAPPGDPRRGRIAAIASAAHQAAGDLRRAVETARAAVAATPQDHVEHAERLGALCKVLFTAYQRRPDPAALNELIRAAENQARAAPFPHPQWSHAQTLLAEVLAIRATENRDTAEMTTALMRVRGVATDDTVTTTDRITAAWRWAETARGLGDTAAALRAFELALSLLPRTARTSLDRADRERHLGSIAGLASEAAACALDDGDTALALRFLEQGRGVLLDQAVRTRADLGALTDEHPELATELSRLTGLLDTATSGATTAEAAAYRRDLDRRLDAVLGEIRALPGWDGFLVPPTDADLRRRTRERLAVVLTASRHRADAIVIVGGEPSAVALPDLDATALATEFRRALEATRQGTIAVRVEAQRALIGLLARLWDDVAGPVLERAGVTGDGERPRIWWVPTGPFVELPLHAAGRPGGPAVFDRAVSSYLSTLRSLPLDEPGDSDAPTPLAIAMPETPEASDLPGVREEIEDLRELHPALTLLSGVEATRAAVLERLPDHTWVHFACHVTAGEGSADTRVLLGDSLENPLTVADLAALRLDDAQLAYLSACGTSRAPERLADESVHVAGAFQMAGFAHVIGTLWPVADRPAAAVAAAFHHGVARTGAGGSARALDAAVAALRASRPTTPSLWAAHIHVGP